ncbi:uncharacterized protein AC631_01616 [Debaryomyces fabryi]|uniref:ADF-H domain-containing protein n=1 Tax=Debaryomyces fabryi TaxID=58627 RepID=A0A0V1Q2Z6_9ASCO|nr:uncharacterized protein AC631_01616 [Debaryomyces fabryi]KSA02629.1 hypothetical protein AC631_01616 [Debaryomyces fabryi]CUM45739.1 unnamed protein product [Debaryomyces fabryi]
MSTQSGIVSSEGLLDTFKNFKSGSFVIKVSSDNTQLIVDDEFQSKETDVSKALLELNKYISGIYPHPVYIILALSSTLNSNSDYAFISFIPDVAPIREKMLYASTKNTLLTQLGSNNFSKSHIFAWTELDELSFENFKHSSEVQEDGPLTHEEKTLQEVNSLQGLTLAESGARRSNDTAYKKKLASMHDPSSTSGGVLMFTVDSELESEFKVLSQNTDNGKLIIFGINLDNEGMELISSTTGVKSASLVNDLESVTEKRGAHPLFALYNYSTNKFAFVYSCPSGSKVKERMVYASNKQGLINHLRDITESDELLIDKIFEIGDLDELEVNELEISQNEEKNPASTTRNGLKFTKPKGPRRR